MSLWAGGISQLEEAMDGILAVGAQVSHTGEVCGFSPCLCSLHAPALHPSLPFSYLAEAVSDQCCAQGALWH